MQTIQWTNEVIIACGVIVLACILLGYFIASLLQGRQLKLLAMQLEQGQATASAQQEALKEKLRAAEGRSHELQVIEGKLQAQLRAWIAGMHRCGGAQPCKCQQKWNEKFHGVVGRGSQAAQ